MKRKRHFSSLEFRSIEEEFDKLNIYSLNCHEKNMSDRGWKSKHEKYGWGEMKILGDNTAVIKLRYCCIILS